jgi:endoglucanase
MIVGGPNSGRQDGCVYESTLNALSYSDTYCSYASNEIAINWNAPLAYLSSGISALHTTGLSIRSGQKAKSG